MAAQGGEAPTMSAHDMEVCRQTISLLLSQKYKDKNYLFKDPFDLSQVPGYLDVCQRQLDISTVSKNLENGMYRTKDEFFADAMLIFENARKYHTGRPQTQWIVKPAKDMLKVVEREKRNAEKKVTKPLGLIKKSPPIKKDPSSTSDEKKAPTIKLKLSTGIAKEEPQSEEKPVAVKAKPTQPKLKLKLSLSQKTSQPLPTAMKVETPKSPSINTASKAENKIQVKPQGPRGKELPKGVTAPQKPPKASTKNKAAAAQKAGNRKPSIGTTPVPPAETNRSVPAMVRKEQLMKVVSGLRRRKYKDVTWFVQPVSLKQMDDYRAKIKFPMDLGTISSKVEKNQYTTFAEFVLDVRRIFANCLRFNTSVNDNLRPVAVDVLSTAEELMAWFIAKPEAPAVPYPSLLYCWQLCVSILNTICNLTNPGEDGLPTAYFFLHPVSVYCGGNYPADYLSKVPRPMDFGTITSMLLEGHYQTVEAFASDCRLVIGNCMSYYGGRADGRDIIEQANRLNGLLSQQLDALVKYDQSTVGAAAKASALSYLTVKLEKPPESLLMSILTEMRSLQYTDKATQITESATQALENPEPIALYPDYSQLISTPMDLQQIERRVRSGFYETPEDFEYDMFLLFRNCEVYHSAKKNEHRVSMGKYAAKQFRKLFILRMRAWEDPGATVQAAQPINDAVVRKDVKKDAKRMASPSLQNSQPVKKIKIEASGGVSKGKSAPRISISGPPSSAAVEKGGQNTIRVKSPKTPSSSTSTSTKKKPPEVPKSKQPLPLHVAIARVKEGFPLRRPLKDLQDWEKACARFLKELLRHSWISAARPKFIFHVPVSDLFPELRDAYVAKIRKPMDLTTVECTLMHGSRYAGAEDFVNDVALVFVNAITFNKDSRDLGDPLSCAYYDASVHLLRFTRWLSLEHLSEYLEESDYVDVSRSDDLPPFSWKLTTGNRKKAREETEHIVLNEPIEKSIEGDRYTWMESECEKLLKALRHQSDLRYMTFFIQPNYPPDYTAFISKSMDWERCQRTLKKRQYDKFGDIIADLRLIFSNALKYNARLKGTDTISGKAYEAAKYMSNKLEAAIDKMMISVSDRLERERIDHANAEREIEAAERAEQEQIRAAWKSQAGKEGPSASLEPPPIERSGFVNRRVVHRKPSNFEMSFFEDDEEGAHEQTHIDSLKQQKSLFEKQRLELSKTNQLTRIAGGAVFSRLTAKDDAMKWIDELTAKYKPLNRQGSVVGKSSVSSESNTFSQKAREQVKIKLPTVKQKGARRKVPTFTFD